MRKMLLQEILEVQLHMVIMDENINIMGIPTRSIVWLRLDYAENRPWWNSRKCNDCDEAHIGMYHSCEYVDIYCTRFPTIYLLLQTSLIYSYLKPICQWLDILRMCRYHLKALSQSLGNQYIVWHSPYLSYLHQFISGGIILLCHITLSSHANSINYVIQAACFKSSSHWFFLTSCHRTSSIPFLPIWADGVERLIFNKFQPTTVVTFHIKQSRIANWIPMYPF